MECPPRPVLGAGPERIRRKRGLRCKPGCFRTRLQDDWFLGASLGESTQKLGRLCGPPATHLGQKDNEAHLQARDRCARFSSWPPTKLHHPWSQLWVALCHHGEPVPPP